MRHSCGFAVMNKHMLIFADCLVLGGSSEGKIIKIFQNNYYGPFYNLTLGWLILSMILQQPCYEKFVPNNMVVKECYWEGSGQEAAIFLNLSFGTMLWPCWQLLLLPMVWTNKNLFLAPGSP